MGLGLVTSESGKGRNGFCSGTRRILPVYRAERYDRDCKLVVHTYEYIYIYIFTPHICLPDFVGTTAKGSVEATSCAL